jgi:hypothetical protein
MFVFLLYDDITDVWWMGVGAWKPTAGEPHDMFVWMYGSI